jgi:signal transduction histidine kinase
VTRFLRHRFDALVVVLAVVQQVEVWIASVPGPKPAVMLASLLWTLPLLLRHRFPFAAPAFVFAVQAASAIAYPPAFGGYETGGASLLLAFWVVGAYNERSQAIAGAAIGVASIAVTAQRDVRLDAVNALLISFIAVGVCLVAFALRRRAERAARLEGLAVLLEREREERARAAVAAERARIARDLHDVIAHSVSVMTVQAGAARLLLEEEPERARKPLLAVEETGRQALAEMRRLFGIVRGNEAEAALAPQPSLARLDTLLEEVGKAGLPVEVTVEGEHRVLSPGVDLTAYRIVQEALTNARKHACPARAQVTIRYAHDALDLEITNDGRRVGNGEGPGHGLVGMRERVALYGGELEAAPRAGGGYVVRARLPVEAEPA